MSEKEPFDLNELPGQDEITAGDLAKLETDPDFIAFRDGTDVRPEDRISHEEAKKFADEIFKKRDEELEREKKENPPNPE